MIPVGGVDPDSKLADLGLLLYRSRFSGQVDGLTIRPPLGDLLASTGRGHIPVLLEKPAVGVALDEGRDYRSGLLEDFEVVRMDVLPLERLDGAFRDAVALRLAHEDWCEAGAKPSDLGLELLLIPVHADQRATTCGGQASRASPGRCRRGCTTRRWRRRCSRPRRRRGCAGRSRTGAISTRELQRHKGVTLQLLWLEYREVHPHGYQYSWFCELEGVARTSGS